MKHTFKTEELQNKDSDKYISNKLLLLILINERQSNCTNVYAPLYKRLADLKKVVEDNYPE